MTESPGANGRKQQTKHRGPAVSTTYVGVGTSGMGPEAKRSDPAQVAFREWCRSKVGTQKGSLPPLLSPREFNKALLAGLQDSKDNHIEQQQRTKAELRAESEALLRQAEQENKELLALRREFVQRTRHRDEEAHEGALEAHENVRKSELKATRVAMMQNRDLYLKIAEDERRAEMERIAAAKEQWKAAKEASIIAREAERLQRIEEVRLQKAKDEERLQKWRSESSSSSLDRTKLTQTHRHELHEAVSTSKQHALDQRAREVGETKAQLEQTQLAINQRRAEANRQLRVSIEQVKQQQVSMYAEKLEELAQKRKANADELKERSKRGKEELEEDRKRRNEETAARRDEVRSKRSHS